MELGPRESAVNSINEEWRSPNAMFELRPKWLVSNLGRFKYSGDTPHKNTPRRDGYCHKTYMIRGKRRHYLDHRVVAATFIANPLQLPTVNHINGIRHDNRVVNLEWASVSEQNSSSHRNKERVHEPRRPVRQLKDNGELIRTWGSATIAAKELRIQRPHIVGVCSGSRIRCGGFKWEYVTEFDDLHEEVWKQMKADDECDLIWISSKGRMRDSKGFPHHGTLQFSDYRYVDVPLKKLSSNSPTIFKGFRLHRLVALAFLDRKDATKNEVNHKDGNRENNEVSNLEWVNSAENAANRDQRKRQKL